MGSERVCCWHEAQLDMHGRARIGWGEVRFALFRQGKFKLRTVCVCVVCMCVKRVESLRNIKCTLLHG